MDHGVADALKNQVNKEFFSAYLYLAFSNYYAGVNLDGFANWFEVQAQEELQHAMKFLKYLQDNGELVTLEAIAQPDATFSNNREPLAGALEHEKYVTDLINKIYSKAREVNDYRCCQFLDWFIAEQGEEEKNTSELLAKYDLLSGDAKGLYLLNNELKTRQLAVTDTAAEA